MKKPLRVLLWVLLIAFLISPFALYWAADAWLESAGGQRLLEKELSRRTGLAVHLQGDFDLMLLPDIGVSGTGLVMGGPGPEAEALRSQTYEISVALKPLFEKQLVIEWIRVSGAVLHPERFSSAQNPRGEKAGFSLPDIRELSLRDLTLVLPGPGGATLEISELTLAGFSEGRKTPFKVEVRDLGSASGALLFDSSRTVFQFEPLQLDLGGQILRGVACLVYQPVYAADADLTAETLDIDALRAQFAVFSGESFAADAAESQAPALQLNARLSVAALTGSGSVARDATVVMGNDPSCP